MLNIRRVASSRGRAVVSSHQQLLWKTPTSSTMVPNITNQKKMWLEGSVGSNNNNNQYSFQSIRSFSNIPIPGGVSSLSEPGLNLFDTTAPLDAKDGSSTTQQQDASPPIVVSADVKDAQLRADIRAMGRMLGTVIQDYEGQGVYSSFC